MAILRTCFCRLAMGDKAFYEGPHSGRRVEEYRQVRHPLNRVGTCRSVALARRCKDLRGQSPTSRSFDDKVFFGKCQSLAARVRGRTSVHSPSRQRLPAASRPLGRHTVRGRYGSTTTHPRLVAVAAASIASGSAASGKRLGRMAPMSSIPARSRPSNER